MYACVFSICACVSASVVLARCVYTDYKVCACEFTELCTQPVSGF